MMPNLEKISPFRWRIKKTPPMNAEVVIFASEKLLKNIKNDKSIYQLIDARLANWRCYGHRRINLCRWCRNGY